jgi:translation elongation factor EF-Tu-like GTPase
MRKLKTIIFIFGILSFGCNNSTRKSESMEFKMVIQDVFNIKTNSGPTVIGKIEKGKIVLGEKIILVSNSSEFIVEVTKLEKFEQENLQQIKAGTDDVGITISGISFDKIKKGDILITKH